MKKFEYVREDGSVATIEATRLMEAGRILRNNGISYTSLYEVNEEILHVNTETEDQLNAKLSEIEKEIKETFVGGKVIKRVMLNKMPFDRADCSGFGLVHATGYRVQLEDGTWWDEFEDDNFEDADNCEFSYEESED